MKTKFLGLAVTALTLVACNNQPQQAEQKADAPVAEQKSELKIAYVEIDSLMSQYKFCKDFTLTLTKKGENIRNTLNKKGQDLQVAINNFQEKIQQNAYTREQAEQVQASLQKRQADLQALQERLSGEFDAEQAKYNLALRDSLQNFLKDYNRTKKYDLIISKAGDNILYGNSRMNITQDVVNGLNKRYKPADKEKK